MPRTASPHVRTALVEQAAAMLAGREPVSLRALAARVGVSTMAVYTHFGGMPALWAAVRQEGFARLATRLADVGRTGDPVRDVVAVGRAYADNALAHPTLYRAMFDDVAALADPDAAAATFRLLVDAITRAVDAGRLAADTDPEGLAVRYWAVGHGLLSLVVSGVLTADVLHVQVPATAEALLVAAGDEPARCRASVRAGWAGWGDAPGEGQDQT